MVVATPTLAMGKGGVAKGKVNKLAKHDMDVKLRCEHYEDQGNACHSACHE